MKDSGGSFTFRAGKCSLACILFLALTACQTLPATVKPLPPLVDCTLPMTAQIPDWPTADRWVAEGKAYAVTLLGIVTDDRITHAQEGDCLGKLRKAGLIR